MSSSVAIPGALALGLIAAFSAASQATAIRATPASAPIAAKTIAKAPLRKPFDAAERVEASIPDFPDIRFFGDDLAGYQKALPSRPGPWLVLSAGGSDGAYGAGVIESWSRSGSEPDFSVITGVSTGAMIAVYAFAGKKYDADLKRAYTGITAADIFEVAPTADSLVDDWPFRDLVAKRVTPRLLADIAARQATGRRLFVVTTDLDAGRPVVWNMGAIAARGGPQALALFRQVLVASGSIPGVFQPSLIKSVVNGRPIREMHADGGIATPFYLAPESALAAGVPLPVFSIRILFNGKLSPDFEMTDSDTLSILGRAFGLALRAGGRAELGLVGRWAGRTNVPVSVGSISPSFDVESKDAFDPDYMKALFESGEAAAKDGSAAAPLPTQGFGAQSGGGAPSPDRPPLDRTRLAPTKSVD